MKKLLKKFVYYVSFVLVAISLVWFNGYYYFHYSKEYCVGYGLEIDENLVHLCLYPRKQPEPGNLVWYEGEGRKYVAVLDIRDDNCYLFTEHTEEYICNPDIKGVLSSEPKHWSIIPSFSDLFQ